MKKEKEAQKFKNDLQKRLQNSEQLGYKPDLKHLKSSGEDSSENGGIFSEGIKGICAPLIGKSAVGLVADYFKKTDSSDYYVSKEKELSTLNLKISPGEREKFWKDYMGEQTWSGLSLESKDELVDAYINHQFLCNGVMVCWDSFYRNLCKVIERELQITFIKPIDPFKGETEFDPPQKVMGYKQVQDYKKIYQTLVAERDPTFGQMRRLLDLYFDEVMEDCTSVLIKARKSFNIPDRKLKVLIDRLIELLDEEVLIREIDERYNINKFRNRATHPGGEEICWGEYKDWLMEQIGKPPRGILQTVVELRRTGENEIWDKFSGAEAN